MTDGPEIWREGQRTEADGPVRSLANEALRVLAFQKGAGPARMSERLLVRLRDAVLSSDFDARSHAIRDLRSNGVSVEDLIDLYVPEIARRLGAEWCADQTSFADVTIGAARLQGLLRDLLNESAPVRAPRNAAGVAVVVIADEYHTLGALVLTAQLRRLGVSVRLLLGSSTQSVLDLMAGEAQFDAILISASHAETLVQLGHFVEKLRKQTNRSVPIVVGGPVMETGTDVKAATGADFATSDVVEALRLCQLKISPHTAVAKTKAK